MLFSNRLLLTKIYKTNQIDERFKTNLLAVAKECEDDSMQKMREHIDALNEEYRFLKRLKSQKKRQTCLDDELMRGIFFFFDINYAKVDNKNKSDLNLMFSNINKQAEAFVKKYPSLVEKIKEDFVEFSDEDFAMFESRYQDKIEETKEKLHAKHKEYLKMKAEVKEHDEFYDDLYAEMSHKEISNREM